jgi:hypothetical protein
MVNALDERIKIFLEKLKDLKKILKEYSTKRYVFQKFQELKIE